MALHSWICPHCGERNQSRTSSIGRLIRCPACGHRTRLLPSPFRGRSASSGSLLGCCVVVPIAFLGVLGCCFVTGLLGRLTGTHAPTNGAPGRQRGKQDNLAVAERKEDAKKRREQADARVQTEDVTELQRADQLFAKGERADAVRRYKGLFAFAKSDEQTEMLRRIVEYEVAKGDPKEARRWIETGLDRGLAPSYSTPGAADLLANVQAERDQKAAAAKKDREAEVVRQRDARVNRIAADLRSDIPKTRRAAIKAAGELGEHGKAVAARLVAILADKEYRDAAFEALVHVGKAAVPELIKGLDNKNQFVRLWSAHALGRIGPAASDATPVLRERARSDASINVRDAAQAALAKIRN